eukprot:524377_1
MGSISTSEHLEDSDDDTKTQVIKTSITKEIYVKKQQENANTQNTKIHMKPISPPTKKQTLNKNIIPKVSQSAEITAPNFVNINTVLSHNKESTFCEYVREIRSMHMSVMSPIPSSSKHDIFYVIVNGYINMIDHDHTLHKIIPIDIIELIYLYYKYDNVHVHDIIVDKQLKEYQILSDEQKQDLKHNSFVINVKDSLMVEKGHNIYNIKHSQPINDLKLLSKFITIKINQNIESKHKHLILSFIHDFVPEIYVCIQFKKIINLNSNGSIIINTNDIAFTQSVHSDTVIQYAPSSNIFIKCNNFNCLDRFYGHDQSKQTCYSEFVGDLIIQANQISSRALYHNPLLYFGSIFIDCTLMCGIDTLYLNALNSNIIIKCKNYIRIRSFDAIAFGYIYIQCKGYQTEFFCNLATVSKHYQKDFFGGQVVNDQAKIAGRFIEHCLENEHGKALRKISGDTYYSQTMPYERECKYLNKFNFDKTILNAILNENICVKTNKFIYFNVNGNIMCRHRHNRSSYVQRMQTVTDALIIKSSYLYADIKSCYTHTGFRLFRVTKYKHR